MLSVCIRVPALVSDTTTPSSNESLSVGAFHLAVPRFVSSNACAEDDASSPQESAHAYEDQGRAAGTHAKGKIHRPGLEELTEIELESPSEEKGGRFLHSRRAPSHSHVMISTQLVGLQLHQWLPSQISAHSLEPLSTSLTLSVERWVT